MPSPEYSVELEMGEPPPELQEYARDLKRGECTPHRMDDEFLLRFLRARRFIPHRAHRLMVNYYQFKEDNHELFENVFPMDLRHIGDANVIAVPPYRDQDGRRLIFFRIGCWDPKSIPIEDLFRGTLMALELGLLEQRTQIMGGVALFDLEDIGTQHAWQITPAVASRMVKMLVSSFPANTHAIHIINHSWIFDKIYNIFKPLLTADMRSRIFFHGYDQSSLHKHIFRDHLPERYGGIWPYYSYTIWLESLKKNFVVAKAMIANGYKFREDEICPKVVRQLKEEGIELA